MLYGQWQVQQGMLQIIYPALAKNFVFFFLRMWSGAYNRQRTRAIQKGTTKGATLNSKYPSLLLWSYYVQLYAELILSICEYDISQYIKQVQFHCYP